MVPPFDGVAILPRMSNHIDRYVPAETNSGWGFAGAVVTLALILIASVTYIHKTTYKHPTDVTWHGRGSAASHAPAASAEAKH